MTIKESTDKLSQLCHTASQSDADYALRTRVTLSKGLMAASTKKDTTKIFLLYTHKAITVKSLKIFPTTTTNKSADDVNYSGVDLSYDDGAGGAATILASVTNAKTAGSTFTAGKILSMSGITVGDTVAAGQAVYLQLSTAGNGLEINPFEAILEWEYQ